MNKNKLETIRVIRERIDTLDEKIKSRQQEIVDKYQEIDLLNAEKEAYIKWLTENQTIIIKPVTRDGAVVE